MAIKTIPSGFFSSLSKMLSVLATSLLPLISKSKRTTNPLASFAKDGVLNALYKRSISCVCKVRLSLLILRKAEKPSSELTFSDIIESKISPALPQYLI